MTSYDTSSDTDDSKTEPQLDEAVSYPMAARALRCSRRTIERHVEAGRLDRAPDATAASVTRRSLVSLLEDRGADERQLRDTAHIAATGVAALPAAVEQLLEQLSKTTERAATAEAELRLLEQQVGAASDRDELIVALISGSWSERRAARVKAGCPERSPDGSSVQPRLSADLSLRESLKPVHSSDLSPLFHLKHCLPPSRSPLIETGSTPRPN